MQKKIQISKAAIAGIVIFLIMLVLVRLYQDDLFYDPFLDYYAGENSDSIPLPQYDSAKLGFHLLFRYGLNSIFSLGILWLIFKDKGIFKLSAFLYVLFFLVLIISFYLALGSNDPDMLLVFYIRRFIIQPLFLILFVPAFYYQNKA